MKKRNIITIGLLFLSIQIFSLEFKDVTDSIDNAFEVQSALLNVKQIQNEILLLTHPEDMNFSFSPSVKATTQEGETFGKEIEIYGAASAKIPLGLSSLEKERLDFAIRAWELAEASVEKAKEQTFIKIHSLYQKLWLLQEEEKIIQLEVLAAEDSLKMLDQRFALGNASLIDLSTADETLQERTNNYLQNQLDQRITRFELNSLTSLDIDIEPLEKWVLPMEELPKPPELYTWVSENDSDIIFERNKLLQLEQTLSRMREPDVDFSVRSFYNSVGNTFTANLNYDFNNPELTPSVTFPLHTLGEIPSSSGSTETWNLGLAFNISLGTNRRDNLESDMLMMELLNGKVKLDYMIESANLALRSAYQQHMRDLEALEQAQRVLVRSRHNHEIIETKKELGQVSESEILESESIVERSVWKIEVARINAEESWLKLLESAVWFKKVEIL